MSFRPRAQIAQMLLKSYDCATHAARSPRPNSSRGRRFRATSAEAAPLLPPATGLDPRTPRVTWRSGAGILIALAALHESIVAGKVARRVYRARLPNQAVGQCS